MPLILKKLAKAQIKKGEKNMFSSKNYNTLNKIKHPSPLGEMKKYRASLDDNIAEETKPSRQEEQALYNNKVDYFPILHEELEDNAELSIETLYWTSLENDEVHHNLDAFEEHFSSLSILGNEPLPDIHLQDKINFGLNEKNQLTLEHQGKQFLLDRVSFSFDPKSNFLGKISSISYQCNTVTITDENANYYECSHSNFNTFEGDKKRLIMESNNKFIVQKLSDKKNSEAAQNPDLTATETVYTKETQEAVGPMDEFLSTLTKNIME